MPSMPTGPRPKNSRALIRPRQLTIGECAAIARYAPHHVDGVTGKVSIPEILQLIDRLAVCTTCGWPVHTHDADRATLKALRCCGQYRRVHEQ